MYNISYNSISVGFLRRTVFMKKRILALALCLVMAFCALPFTAAADTANVVEDSALLSYLIDEGYDYDNDGGISADEMADVWIIDARGMGIESLEGLQYATMLLDIIVSDNNITDISPIANLEFLFAVDLTNNKLSGTIDFAQTSWAFIENVNLGYNEIESVQNATSLMSVLFLDLSYNKLSDITELTGLTTVETLLINNNKYSLDPSGSDYGYFAQIESENSGMYMFVYEPQLVDGIEEDFDLDITDANLLQALLDNGVDVTDDGKISACELGNVYTALNLSGYGITDISALEYAVNAESVDLSDNAIESVSALSGLTQLKSLDISDNAIEDISALSGLTNLADFNAGGNKIEDISVVAGFTALTNLDLSRNSIKDASALENLTALKVLSLSDNFISSIKLESSFDNLDLSYNVFTSVTDLVSLSAATLDITYNNLVASEISASDFANVTNLVYAQQTQYDGSYRDVVEFPDSALLDVLLKQKYINTDGDNVITKGELADFNGVLNLKDTGVTDITGLRYMKKLNTLRIDDTQISDISEVAQMTNLEVFTAANSAVSDLSALTQLQKLQYITVPNTKVTNIDVLSDNKLSSLISINLKGNGLTDVSALKNIPTLKTITLSSNSVSDLSFLSSITAPQEVYLDNNEIENIDVIYTLSTLKELDVSSNWIDVPTDFADAMYTNNENLVLLKYDNQRIRALADIIVDTAGSNYFTLEINGESDGLMHQEYVQAKQIGDVFVARAIEDGDEFLYWKNDNGVVLSYEAEYRFVVVSSLHVTAVYKQNHSRGSYVSFFSQFDQELMRSFYSKDSEPEEIEIPELPVKDMGYTFVGWSLDGETVLGNDELRTAIIDAVQDGYVRVTPIFVEDDELFTVTVVNGTGGGQYAMRTTASVTADEPEDGYKFAYWVDENEQILSYEATYYFIVTNDTTLTAVYVAEDDVVEKQAVITITEKMIDAEANIIRFVAVRDIPEEYTVVKTGIILTNDASIGLDDDAFVIGAAGILTGTDANNTNLGTYVVAKSRVQAGETWYARGYVVYTDANGELVYLYSAIESATLEA